MEWLLPDDLAFFKIDDILQQWGPFPVVLREMDA